MENYGDKKELFGKITNDFEAKFAAINYGPWDFLRGMKPFVEGYEKQPLGANFYPADIKYLEYVDMKFEDKYSMFTVLKRDDKGNLYTLPYHKAFKAQVEKISDLLKKAAAVADDPQFKKYLELKAKSFLTDDYLESDLAWMDLKNNKIDFIAGPIDDEVDRFLNTKTAHIAYILLKDTEWENKLSEIQKSIPDIIKNLPVDASAKKLIPVSKNEIEVFNVVYYAGYANAGSKTISLFHPRDGRVHMEKGNKKLMFYNATKAKFDNILKPIADLFVANSDKVTFDAFFLNNLFYEVADAIDINNTVKGEKVKDVLKGNFNTMNGLRADVLRLYIMTEYLKSIKASEDEFAANYATFFSNILRSVRFGAAHAQGISNVICFYYFTDAGAINRNKNGKYEINVEKMKNSVTQFATEVLTIFTSGDLKGAQKLIDEKGNIQPTLQKDLMKIMEAGIPRDIYFKQGPQVLGL